MKLSILAIVFTLSTITFAEGKKKPRNTAPRVITNETLNSLPGPGQPIPMTGDQGSAKSSEPVATAPISESAVGTELNTATTTTTGTTDAAVLSPVTVEAKGAAAGTALSTATTTTTGTTGAIASSTATVEAKGAAADSSEASAKAKTATSTTTTGGHGHSHNHGEKGHEKKEEKK